VAGLRSVVVLLAAAALAGAAAAAPAGLPGAKAIKTCAAAGPFWPTETLALERTTAWLACKEQSRIVRVDLRSGKVLRSVRLGGPVIAVAIGYGSMWALDSGGVLARVVPASGRVSRRIVLGTSRPYNIWVGAGSVWVVDDGAGAVIRVSPATDRVTARIAVGDGPADMVFAGPTGWVVNHRDRGLVRVDTRTNKPTKLTTLPGDDTAPERMALLAGSLWITGRGTDLLQVDPATGAVKKTVDIGAGGIDVVVAGGSLWVPSRSEAVDPTGFPTMETLRRVSTDGSMTTVARATGRVDVHGLAGSAGALWIADNTGGFLYRVRV
jgi:virginiamycin B lyase